MRKILSLLLAVAFALSLTACKKNSDTTSSIPDNTTSGFINLDLVPEDENTSNLEQGDNTSSFDDTTSNPDLQNPDNQINNNDPLSSNIFEGDVNSSYPNIDTDTSPTKKPSNNTNSNTNSGANTDNNQNANNTSSNPDSNNGNNLNNNIEQNATNNNANNINNDKNNTTNSDPNVDINNDKNNTTSNNTNSDKNDSTSDNDKDNTSINNTVSIGDANNTTSNNDKNNTINNNTDKDKNNTTNNTTNNNSNNNNINDSTNNNDTTSNNTTSSNDKNNTTDNKPNNDKNNTTNNNKNDTTGNDTNKNPEVNNNKNDGVNNNTNDTNNTVNPTDKNNTSSNATTVPGTNDNNTQDKDNQTNNNENNTNPPQNNNHGNQNGNNNNQGSNNTNDNDNNDNTNKGSYKDINCRSITEWKTIELVSNNNSLYFSISLPNDWSIENNGIIKFNNIQIGHLSTKTETYTNIFEEIKSDNTISGTTASSSIREYINDKQLSYKRVIRISKLANDGNLTNLYISADYSQLDNNATSKILNSLSDKNHYRPTPVLDKSSTKNILFLGNKNIENSKIDVYLSSMLSSGNKSMRTQFFGGEEVDDFITNDIISKISNGDFSIVFINGFYTEKNTIEPIKKIIDACKTSNTKLVLLPAYDDSDSIIESILNAHPEVFCIDWKNDILNLIATSDTLVSSDFFTSDYKSSTDLSGYVGAHLIYRTIFEDTPPTITDNLPSGFDKIKNLLPKAESKKDIFFIQ